MKNKILIIPFILLLAFTVGLFIVNYNLRNENNNNSQYIADTWGYENNKREAKFTAYDDFMSITDTIPYCIIGGRLSEDCKEINLWPDRIYNFSAYDFDLIDYQLLFKQVLTKHPKKIFLQFDAVDLRYIPGDKFKNYGIMLSEFFLSAHRAGLKAEDIYVLSFLPVNNFYGEKYIDALQFNMDVNRINYELFKVCKNDGLTFINITDILCKSDFLKPRYTIDGVQLNNAGYNAMFSVLERYF